MTAAGMPFHQVRRVAASMLAALLLLPALAGSPEASAAAVERFVSVIVQGLSPVQVEKAVTSVGGRVTESLPIVNGSAARVPAGSENTIRRAPGVVHVSPNTKIEFQGRFDGAQLAHQIPKVTGSADLWSQGIDGSGSTVALIDTGVYNHPDLAGRVTCGIDLSHERGTEAECADTFGHGTFMAGLIAGNGTSSAGKYKGAAPGANIVSVKVAGFDGSTDITHVLAAIQWVVSFKDTYGIDVLSLSLGTDTAMDYRLNPLNFAVERAWQSGITVVVSASNRGPTAGTITSPADDPYVITVGASNHQGSVSLNDDTVPVFSGRGPTASNGLAKPDVVTPGTHTVSLRSPGSAIDQYYPGSVVDSGYFKGTGSSMATASVAGQVAQILQANPALTPNQVKFRLMETARPIGSDPMASGRGVTDVQAAATSTLTGEANQGLTMSTGLGPLTPARGSLQVWVQTPAGSAPLGAELTAQFSVSEQTLTNPLGLLTWDASKWSDSEWDASKWSASKWSTEEWAASKWSVDEWTASKWSASKWSGTTWTNTDWDASKWSSTDWDASKWSASKWSSAWYAAAWD